MKSIPDRARKLARLRLHQRGLCACGCGLELIGPVDLHHRLHDTAGNRTRYPELIHHILNLAAVRHDCHMTRPMPGLDYRPERYLKHCN